MIKNKIIDCALDLAANQSWGDISLYNIARASEVDLVDVRALFPDKNDIIAAYARQLDAMMVEDLADNFNKNDPLRDQLFDIFMVRFDLLNDNRKAVISILNTMTLDPHQALLSLPNLAQSVSHMLSLSHYNHQGIKRAVMVAGLSVLYLKSLRSWVGDDSQDLAATMATLDQGLNWIDKIQ